jgi:acyl dehydratase
LSTRYFGGFRVGESRSTTGRTITEADIVIHAGHTGDFYPHHMDAEWTKTQPFGQRIAHGTLVFSVAVGMTAHEINPAAFTYGYDRLRFVKPVFIGDTITVSVTVDDKKDDPKRPTQGFVYEKCEVTNQRGETVLVFTHVLAVEKEPPDERGDPL